MAPAATAGGDRLHHAQALVRMVVLAVKHNVVAADRASGFVWARALLFRLVSVRQASGAHILWQSALRGPMAA